MLLMALSFGAYRLSGADVTHILRDDGDGRHDHANCSTSGDSHGAIGRSGFAERFAPWSWGAMRRTKVPAKCSCDNVSLAKLAHHWGRHVVLPGLFLLHFSLEQ
jgi:hypothetical protein